MAAGVINLQKASGGVTKITGADGTGITNLVVPESGTLATEAQVSIAQPAGAIITFAASTAPTGYLKCNGALLSRTTYSNLFAAIGTTFGVGDGSTTFALPDLRGYFPRGWDDGRGIDTGRTFGSAQADDIISHNHGIVMYTGPAGVNYAGSYAAGLASIAGPVWFATSDTGGVETRPRNIALLYCIKY